LPAKIVVLPPCAIASLISSPGCRPAAMVLTNASFNFWEGAALLKGLGEWPAFSSLFAAAGQNHRLAHCQGQALDFFMVESG